MATDNPLWGEEPIANELRLKLGIRVSPRTVRKYMPKRPADQPRGDQRWGTCLRNHAKAILACDFFVTVTATFRLLDWAAHVTRKLVKEVPDIPKLADRLRLLEASVELGIDAAYDAVRGNWQSSGEC